jgi:hypothetical protein
MLAHTACGATPQDDAEPGDPIDAACVLPPEVVERVDGPGYVIESWTFPVDPVFERSVLPEDEGFLAYQARFRDAGVVERHPALHLPPPASEEEVGIWRDEELNNDLAYSGQVGAIEPLSCLDALLMARHHARMPQHDAPSEFVASVLRRGPPGSEEWFVIFGAGDAMFPPREATGMELVERLVGEGWRYAVFLHNHTPQANGALGVPAPSTSDVRFVRSLAASFGLERVRVTNGFFTYEAAVDELAPLRAR